MAAASFKVSECVWFKSGSLFDRAFLQHTQPTGLAVARKFENSEEKLMKAVFGVDNQAPDSVRRENFTFVYLWSTKGERLRESTEC